MKSHLGINVNSVWKIQDSIFARPANERTTHGHVQDLQVKGHFMRHEWYRKREIPVKTNVNVNIPTVVQKVDEGIKGQLMRTKIISLSMQ